MSLSTIAATRQKEIKASMALDATNTRAAVLPPGDAPFENCIDLARRKGASVLLSASARLAVGLGLKGVLPSTGWAGVTDTPRRNFFRCGSPAPAELRDSTSVRFYLLWRSSCKLAVTPVAEKLFLLIGPPLKFLPELVENLASLPAL